MSVPIAELATLLGLLAVANALLWSAHKRYPPQPDALVDALDALLPQTQCAQCGYAGCRPYAQALAQGAASIDLCPPGGREVQDALASTLGTQVGPPISAPLAVLARIDESRCVGCALCLPACPVDAIVGANGFTHTVLAQQCTGCELCIEPCPVDCIDLVTPESGKVRK